MIDRVEEEEDPVLIFTAHKPSSKAANTNILLITGRELSSQLIFDILGANLVLRELAISSVFKFFFWQFFLPHLLVKRNHFRLHQPL